MAEFPAMPLWTDAYLGDTRHLTTFEHGAYLLLLMVAWRSPDGRLPDDDRLLARYAGCTRAQWARIAPVIRAFFRAENGGLMQGRLNDERNAVRRKRESQSANGRASALKNKERHATKRQPSVNPHTHTSKEKELPNGSSKKTAPLTHDWRPADFGKDTKSAKIIATWPDGRMETEIERFIAHHGSRANVMADWQQAWATWVLNSATFDKERVNGRGNHGQGDRTLRAAEAAFGPASEWSDDRPF